MKKFKWEFGQEVGVCFVLFLENRNGAPPLFYQQIKIINEGIAHTLLFGMMHYSPSESFKQPANA